MNCFTTIDAVGINVGGALALAASALGRWRDITAGLTADDRRTITWQDNASFVARLGLDPADVLGPPPALPAAVAAVDPDHHGDPPARLNQAEADDQDDPAATTGAPPELVGARG